MKLKLFFILFGSSAVIYSSVSAYHFLNNSWTGNGYRNKPAYQQRQEMIYQLEENNRLVNEMNNRDQNYFNNIWF